VLRTIGEWWDDFFLRERPSASLGLFRVAVALTVGLHVFPTLLQLRDNYLSTAFREYNPSFFTIGALEWVAGTSDGFVWVMAAVFSLSWSAYLVGFFTWPAGLVMDAACYYFYARNSLHIGTLSWDILLVVVFLMVVTPYPGDSFSIDAWRRGDRPPWRGKRPFFIQRLLQFQLASTYFYTGLHKITGEGNWLIDNPYYYLMHSPPMGVIKDFPLRGLLAQLPQSCWWIGFAVLSIELTMPVWLFWRRSRPYAIAAGFLFHVLLVATMHVPTIFFFLFPPQLLLYVEPERAVSVVGVLQRRIAVRFGIGRLLAADDTA
jgi:hypothetical protein